MRKKYLSALLFGALLVASTGTFTSCKDYDDDIANLQGQIDGQDGLDSKISALESSIASLQTAQGNIDSKLAEVQDAAEKAALEAQNAAIESAKAELESAKAALQEAIDKNGTDIETLNAAVAEVEKTMSEVSGSIQALQAFQVSTTETIESLNQAVTTLQGQITELEADVIANAEQIGKNKAAIDAQITTLEEYKKSNDEAVAENASQIASILETLKQLQGDPEEGDEMTLTNLAAKVAEINTKLAVVDAAWNKAVTHVSLVVEGTDNTYKSLELVSAVSITDVPFGPNADNQIVFKKGEVSTFDAEFLIRVSPANATLDASNIKLVNSQLGDLSGLVDLKIEPYTGLLSRAVSANGVWKVTAKLVEDYDKDAYDKAAILRDEDGKYKGAIEYAVMIGDSATAVRQVVSEYGLTLNAEPSNIYRRFGVAYDKNREKIGTELKVNGTPIAEIHNRYNADNGDSKGENTAVTETGQGTDVTYIERAWNLQTMLNTQDPDNVYYEHEFDNPTNSASLLPAAGMDFSEDDRRQGKPSLSVQPGGKVTVSLASDIRAYYVSLDKDAAVESAPSELRAWEKYQLSMPELDKLYEGGQDITFTIPAEAENDYIGFRVFAVNQDGSWVDPDGTAFYVYVGARTDYEAIATVATPDYQVAGKPIDAAYTYVKGETAVSLADYEGKATSFAWDLDMVTDGKYLDPADGQEIPVDDAVPFIAEFQDKNGAILFATDDANMDLAANDLKNVAKVVTTANLPLPVLVDGKTYTGVLSLKDDQDRVIATLPVSFTKQLPSKTELPQEFTIKSGQLTADGIFNMFWEETVAVEEANTFYLTDVFNFPANMVDGFSFVFEKAAANGKDNVTVENGNTLVTIDDARVDSKTKHAVSIKFNYGCISSDASKNGPKDIVDATGKWATSYDGYIASEKQFDAVWNSEYQDPNYTWRWAKYGEGDNEFKFNATTGTGNNVKPVEVPAAAVTYGDGKFYYNGSECNLGDLIRGVSSHATSFNNDLKYIIKEGYYEPKADKCHLISNANSVADEYFTVDVDATEGTIKLTKTSANRPAVNVESTLHLEFTDGFGKTITIEIPIVVKP